MMASNAPLMPYNKQPSPESVESVLLIMLGVSGFQETQISVLRFEEKPESEREDILIYIYMNWQDLQQNSLVIEALKETNFVTSAGGDLYKPKDLFDPGDALLISIFSGDVQKFPGERFASDGWLKILRKTGLRNMGDTDTVLECARRVELLGAESMKTLVLVDDNTEDFLNTTAEVSSKIWSLAETLISAIFENFAVLYGNINFCNIFGKIACIPAEKGFPFESGKKSVKRVLCSYSEAILLTDWALAWRAAPILSGESLVPPEYSWGALQLRSPPPFTLVLKHLKAAELHTNSSLSTLEEGTFEVLQYLDGIWGTLSSSDILELKQVAFIAVDNGTRLATSDSLFSHLTINLSPFASKLPPRYLPFLKTLKELGSEDVLSISCAMNILSSLQISFGYHPLNPNELRAVIKILHFLCDESIKLQISDRPNWESQLIVPDDGCRLIRANSSVYIDPYGSQYVKFIHSPELRFVHHDVSERLCLIFGIRKLSDVVVEELDCVEQLETLEVIGSVSLAAVKQKLLSRSFQLAVSRVFNTVSSSTTASENPDFQTLQRSLESVAQRLQFVQCICTRFWLLSNSLDVTHVSKESIIPEWESGSGHQALYYVDHSNTCMLIAEPPSYVSVLDLVAIVVSLVLGSAVPLPIASLFRCRKGTETAAVNILKLPSEHERVTDIVGCGTGFLGREVLPEDAENAILTPVEPFYKGEIVAWRYKREKLKYGRILENVRPPTGKTVCKINLETFPGKTESIFSSQVYYFPIFNVGEEYERHLMPEDCDNVYNSMHFEHPDQFGRVKWRNQELPNKELENGFAPAEELVHAVREILSRSGIRMDIEKQYLLLKTLSLQEQLKESQAALVLQQEQLKMATKEAEKAKLASQCQVCLKDEIEVILVPCGHVLCSPCSSDVCCCLICRTHVSKTIKLYWP